MEVLSLLKDMRINSTNYLIEISIKDYLLLVRDIMKENEFQRKRVKSSQTIYSLLKEDILKNCVVPPVVLALTAMDVHELPTKETFNAFIDRNKRHLLILDGLQRTYSIIDVESELISKGDDGSLTEFYSHKLRAEIYIGINRIGILYRMLTLNTGQTPMSLRQQIEMLYSDYSKVPFGAIELLKEVDGRFAVGLNQFNFRDIVEGFNSYLERNELPIERSDLLENIKSLEKLSQENAAKDIFKDYLETWHSFIMKMNDIIGEIEIAEEFNSEYGVPFGKNIFQVFKKQQSVSGFGAAVGKLKDFGIVTGFDDIKTSIEGIQLGVSGPDFIWNINKSLDWIKNNSKKIGNAQRMFFQYFFRELFNPQSESYLNANATVNTAFHKYVSQNF